MPPSCSAAPLCIEPQCAPEVRSRSATTTCWAPLTTPQLRPASTKSDSLFFFFPPHSFFTSWGRSVPLLFQRPFTRRKVRRRGQRMINPKESLPLAEFLFLYYFLFHPFRRPRLEAEGPNVPLQHPSAASPRLPEGEISFPLLISGWPEGLGS